MAKKRWERDVDAEDKRREERRVYRRAVPPLARSEFIARVISIHKRWVTPRSLPLPLPSRGGATPSMEEEG